MGKTSKAQQAAEMKKYREAQRREAEEKQKKQNRMMWQIILGALALILILTVIPIALGSINNSAKEPEETRDAPEMSELDMSSISIGQFTPTETVTDHVMLNISYTNEHGLQQTDDVIIRLYEDVAPKTVANFQSLVKSDFYDGLTFHRVLEGFMIQGGDPQGNGTGSSTAIVGEMTNNKFENNLSHVRGVVSMARRGGDYNSGSCQFFIVHQNSSEALDDEYASFGYVVYGMDTVDAIAKTEVQVDPSYTGEVTERTEVATPVNPVTINYATFVAVSK